jgi:hypothetical protein
MPRLNNAEYYKRHRFLNYLWQHFQNLYALLPIEQQYDLHNFYRPDWYTTNKADLVAYQKGIKKADPGLSARASRAYVRLEQAYRTVIANGRRKAQSKPLPAKHRKLKRVTIRPVVRPEPDWDKFAYALLQYVRTNAEREQTD